jgi:hypothetical protein
MKPQDGKLDERDQWNEKQAYLASESAPLTPQERRALIDKPFPTVRYVGSMGHHGGCEIDSEKWFGRMGRKKRSLSDYDNES